MRYGRLIVKSIENMTTAGRCGAFAALTAGLWLLLIGPAYFLAATDGLIGVSIAAGLCLVPGLLVLALSTILSASGSPAGAILSGNVLRMLFVLVGSLVVRSFLPTLGIREFIVWLLVFYLATLLAETCFILKLSQPSVQGVGSTSGTSKTAAR